MLCIRQVDRSAQLLLFYKKLIFYLTSYNTFCHTYIDR